MYLYIVFQLHLKSIPESQIFEQTDNITWEAHLLAGDNLLDLALNEGDTFLDIALYIGEGLRLLLVEELLEHILLLGL